MIQLMMYADKTTDENNEDDEDDDTDEDEEVEDFWIVFENCDINLLRFSLLKEALLRVDILTEYSLKFWSHLTRFEDDDGGKKWN